MNPLYRNDTALRHPPSWYAATADIPPLRSGVRGDVRADVAIVGAGFTGLNCALALARKGYRAVVVDAHRVGWGASGRNGGQVGSGFNMDQMHLETVLGMDAARALWDVSMDAKALLKQQVAEFAPNARFRPGVAEAAWTPRRARELKAYVDHLRTVYDYDAVTYVDGAAFGDIVHTPRYVGGMLDQGAGHIHPLRYVFGLAGAVEAAGGVIYEQTEVTGLQDGVLQCAKGRVHAPHIVLAGNGYLPPLQPHYAARVCPINSFIAATAPLSPAQQVLAQDIAVADDKFVVNYFRMSEDGRLLFGGRENYSIGFPRDINTRLVERMERLFPQLRGVQVDYTWGGTLGITMTRVPMVAKLSSGLWAAAGFSGHGVALTGIAGKVIAEAIMGQEERLTTLSLLPTPPFPGGAMMRAPLLTLAMTWYALRDRIGI